MQIKDILYKKKILFINKIILIIIQCWVKIKLHML